MILQTLITQYFQCASKPIILRPQPLRRLSDISAPPSKRRRRSGEPDKLQEIYTRYYGDCKESFDGDDEDYDSDDETVTDDEVCDMLGEGDDTGFSTGLDDEVISGETVNNGRGNVHSLAPGERIPIHTQRPHPITPLHALVLSNNHRDSTFTTFRNSLELVQVKDMYSGYQTKNCIKTPECADWEKTSDVHIGSSPRPALLVDRRDTQRGCGFLLNTKLCSNSMPISDNCKPQRGDLKDELHVRFPSASHSRRLQGALFIRRSILINDMFKMSILGKWNYKEYAKRLLHLRLETKRADRDLERNYYRRRSPLRYFARPIVGKPMFK